MYNILYRKTPILLIKAPPLILEGSEGVTSQDDVADIMQANEHKRCVSTTPTHSIAAFLRCDGLLLLGI